MIYKNILTKGKGVYVCDTRVLNIWAWQKYSSCLDRYRDHLHVSESELRF